MKKRKMITVIKINPDKPPFSHRFSPFLTLILTHSHTNSHPDSHPFSHRFTPIHTGNGTHSYRGQG